MEGGRRAPRFAVLAALGLLHLAAYLIVTRATSARPPAALWQFALPLDAAIPHLPWTWPFYWLAYPFVAVGGGVTLLRLDPDRFRRAAAAIVVMTLVGAAVQLALPARAPWPANPAPTQRMFHSSAIVLPYATLPSMHVAYTVLVAAMIRSVSRAAPARRIALAVPVLVALATLTLKEHVVLDAVTGALLGGATFAWWARRPVP
jgi:hypothetical protein